MFAHEGLSSGEAESDANSHRRRESGIIIMVEGGRRGVAMLEPNPS